MVAQLIPLFTERALIVQTAQERCLVAGDLHLGLERELRRQGVHGVSESEALVEQLQQIASRERVDRIILLGDVKHSIGAHRWEEAALAPLTSVEPAVEVVPGNHDGMLADLVPVTVHDARGIVVDDVGLAHGHTWPAADVVANGRLVLCHNHPHVALVDELGSVQSEPCWLRATFAPSVRERYPDLPLPGELVIVPAFNPLLGGVAMNRPGEKVLGPLLANRMVELADAHAFTLDGLDLGRIARLEEPLRGL